MGRLNVMLKPAADSCNMSCEYCYYSYHDDHAEKNGGQKQSEDKHQEDKWMSAEMLENTVQKSLDFAAAGGFDCNFIFQGGEPALRSLDFYRKAVKFQKNHSIDGAGAVSNFIQTNGLELDEDWADFLASEDFLAGISLDGLPGLHDRYRRSAAGNPTHKRVRENLNMLADRGVEFNILTVINDRTVQQPAQNYRYLRDLGAEYLQFIRYVPEAADFTREKTAPTPEDYGYFLIKLFSLWKEDLERALAGGGEREFTNIRYFENLLLIMMGLSPGPCEMKKSCQAQLVIEADGSVYPCDYYVRDSWRLGSICGDDLEEIMNSPLMKEFLRSSQQLPSQCNNCRWLELCRGGCRYRRSSIKPDNSAGAGYFCSSFRHFFESCGMELRKLASRLERS